MIGGLTKGDKTAEAGKTSNQPREVLVAEHVVNAINDLQKLHDRLCSPQGNDCVNDIQKFAQDGGGLCEFRLLQSYINYVEEDEPSIEKLTIMKFLRSIIEDEELYVKLHNFNFNYLHPDFDGIPGSIDYEEIRSQLSRIVTDCKLENLEDKIRLLALLRGRMDFADIQKAYDNWRFSDLIGDNDFKRMYVDQAVKEREKPVSEYFEENIGKYIKLVEEGKEITSRYFGKWKVNFQAYCEEINNNRVLNVNLIHYDKSEPTRISDVLQQEKDIKELNIYCNKKHKIHAYQKDKKRYYEFKEGACYEMTSTWPVKDEFGNISICTMIINVSSDGITEVLKFDGEDFVSSEEILELIKQNDELYIQGLSLYNAVMKSLEKGKAADVVPTANNNLQNESIVAYQDKEPGGESKGPDPKVDDDNSLHPSPSINSNASTQTKVKLQQIATQTEINSQQTETQTEVNLQQIATQTEVASQQMDELILNNQMLSEENVELKQEMSNLKKEAVELKQEKSDLEDKFDHLEHLNKKMDGNQEQLSEQVLDLQKKLSCSEEVTQELINKLKSAEAEKKEANQELAEAEQRIEALKKQTSDSQDKLEKKERGSKIEINEICKELTQLKENLERNEEELKSVYEEKRKLEEKLKIVNVEKKESEDKLKEFEKEIDQAAHIMKEKEQSISNLKYQMLGLENEYKAQLESDEQEINKLKWEIGELENRYDEFKEHVASTVESMDREHEDEIKELEEKHDALSDIIADKVWEIEDLKSALQNSEKEKEFFHGQVEELSEETVADKQKGFNDQFYTLTGNISSKSDNVPRKKIELSRSLSFNSESDNESYVLLEGERRSLRSSSIDDGYGSGKENCDDDLSSNTTTTSIEKVAESRNVGKALL